MLKRLLSIIIVFSLVLGMAPMALANSRIEPTIKLNGTKVDLKDEVYVNEQGKIMIPLREVIEELGYNVKWNGLDKSITISKESKDIKLAIGDKNTVIKESKTFMPLELLSDSMDLIIGLDNNKKIIKINQPKKNEEEFFEKSNDEKRKTKLNEYMKALEKSENFSGIVLVAKEGNIILNQGYGFSDLNQNTENKPQTTFAVGSITKQFTAMGIMQLVEKDLIKVEDMVSKYIPNVLHGDKITIHNLLTHTSGLVNYTSLSKFLTLDLKNKNQQDMVDLINDLPLDFEPGEKFEYSNTNYLLLGMIIEKITEKPLEDYLKENIFDPLNMKDTGTSYGKDNETPDATSYTGYLEVQPIDDSLILTQAYGAGNIYSTVEDLYKWDRGLETEKIVKKQTLNEVFKEQSPLPGAGSYGYGWMIEDTEFGKEVYHGGNTFGFSSNIARYIDKDLTVIILTNKGGYILTELTNTLTDIVFDKEYNLPEKVKEIEIKDPSLYDKYIGEYELTPGVVFNITKEDNKIYAQLTNQDKYEIFPKSESEFFYKVIDAKITFAKEDGKTTRLILHQNGQDIPAAKTK